MKLFNSQNLLELKEFLSYFVPLADFYKEILVSSPYSLVIFPSPPCCLFSKILIETTLNNRVNEGDRPKDSWVLYFHIPLIHLSSILMSLRILSTLGSTGAHELQKVYIMTNPSVGLSVARKGFH